MSDRKTGVELLLKARDETGPAIKSAEAGLRRLAEKEQKRAELKGIRADVTNIRKLAAEYDAAQVKATKLTQALKSAGLAASGEQVAGFRAVRAEVRSLKTEIVEVGTAILRARGKIASAPGSFAAFDAVASRPTPPAVSPEAAKNALAAAAALRSLRASKEAVVSANLKLKAAEAALEAEQMSGTATAQTLVAAQNRVVAAYNAVQAASKRADIAQQSVARTQMTVARSGGGMGSFAGRVEAAYTTKSDRGPLGLRPYEMTNLSYQINDVVSGLAMGQPVFQVFAQQAGQIAQIFPGVISALVKFSPVIVAAAAVLAPFVTDMKRLGDEAKTLKDMDILLSRIGDGAEYQADKLAATAQALDRYSGSLDDAKAAIDRFVADNVAPEYIELFGRAALDYAKVMRVDVPEAAKMVSDAFTGNADAVLALDDQINFLTDSERDQIELMKESGDEAGVRTKAFDIFARRYGDTADKMKGQWSRILTNFTDSWMHFSDTVNGLDLSGAVNELKRLLGWIERVSASLPGARESSHAAIDQWEADLNRREAALDGPRDDPNLFERGVDAARGGAIGSVLGRVIPGGDLLAPAITSSFLMPTSVRDGMAREDIATQRSQMEVARTTLGFRDGSAPLLRGLFPQNYNADGTPKLPGDTTTEPDAPSGGGSRGGGGQSDAAREAERKAEAQAAFLRDLTLENEERRFQIGLIGQSERSQMVQEVLRKKSLEAQEVGLELTEAQKMEIAFLAVQEHELLKAQEAQAVIEQAQLELAQARGEVLSRELVIARALEKAGLDATSAQGQQLAEIEGALFDLEDGARRLAAADREVNDTLAIQAELRRQIADAEDRGDFAAAELLQEQLDGLNERLLNAIENARQMWLAIGGPDSEQALLALDGLEAGLNDLARTSVTTRAELEDLVSDGALGAWDQFWQGIEEGRNVIASLRDAFLQFAADFLRQIARMIVQQMIFNAIQAAGGGGGGGPLGGLSGFLNGLLGGGGGGGTTPGAANHAVMRAGIRHDGGMVGGSGKTRLTPSSVFSHALRFHKGGIPGLGPNEVPIIAEADEEVLTRRDPRHRMNGGASGRSVKIVNVFDPADILERAAASDAGERTIINVIRKNAGAIKAAIG